MSAAEIAAIATGSVAIGGALGTAAKFVWSKIEARFTRIERALEECRDDRELSEKRRGILITIVELLKQEMRAHMPGSGVLLRADELTSEYRALRPGADEKET